jgi:hypothetical protein
MVSTDNQMIFYPLRKVARLVPDDNDDGEIIFPGLISPIDAERRIRGASRMSESEENMNHTTAQQEPTPLPNGLAQWHVT